MKQQVIYLWWGIPKENYESYYNYLERLKFDPYLKKEKKWKYFLGDNLGSEYEYHRCPFPDKHFADYESWKIIFEKMIPYMQNEVMLVATSLWWSFIVKYLSENNIEFSIKKLFLLAPAFYDTDDEVLWTFHLRDRNYNWVIEQCKKIIIYHSRDDIIVPFSDSEKYLKFFPNAIFKKFDDKGHFFNEMRILELEEDIKK